MSAPSLLGIEFSARAIDLTANGVVPEFLVQFPGPRENLVGREVLSRVFPYAIP